MKFHRPTFLTIALIGLFLTGAFWMIWWMVDLRYHTSGWNASTLGLWYNIPISILFAILGLELLVSILPPIKARLLAQLPFIFIWLIGFAQLYLRLIERNINISGHLTWLTMMLAHSLIRRIPPWFIALIVLIWVKCLYFYFNVMASPHDGIMGILFGSFLSLLLWRLNRITQNKLTKTEKEAVYAE